MRVMDTLGEVVVGRFPGVVRSGWILKDEWNLSGWTSVREIHA